MAARYKTLEPTLNNNLRRFATLLDSPDNAIKGRNVVYLTLGRTFGTLKPPRIALRTVLLVIALAIVPWIANKLGAPPWGTALAAAPLLLYLIGLNWNADDPDENALGDASEPVRRWTPLILGVGGVAFGIGALSLGGTSSLLGLFGWVLPFALIVLLIGVFRFFGK